MNRNSRFAVIVICITVFLVIAVLARVMVLVVYDNNHREIVVACLRLKDQSPAIDYSCEVK